MAGVSSSVAVAVNVPLTLVYSLFGVVLARCVMVAVSSKPLSSCCAVRVTVWGVSQFVAVNVRVFWTPFRLSPSVSSTVTDGVLLVMVAVTVRVGCVYRRTV